MDHHTKEEVWNHHCSYQWTYFPEESKQLIQYFLSDRIQGKNLDVGAGWYNFHPNSTAVDFSKKGLEYNCAPNKILFDLDLLAKGEHLPIPDKSHHSATLVSVYQYLEGRKELLRELERILVPGSEVFIINQGSAGLTEHFRGPAHPDRIEEEVLAAGYDCVREKIPFGSLENPFQSVTVAMPDFNLFGKQPLVRGKERRIRQSGWRMANRDKFYDRCALWEARRAANAFQRLGTYPITKFSQDYVARFQAFADTIQGMNGNLPVIFLDPDIDASLHLATEDNPPYATLTTLGKSNERPSWKETSYDVPKGLRFSNHLNYFGATNMRDLRSHLDSLGSLRDEKEIDASVQQFIRFLAAVPLVKQSVDLQKRIYEEMKPKVKDLDDRIDRAKKNAISSMGMEHKQRRRIDELVAAKKRILADGIPVVGEARLNYLDAMDYYVAGFKYSLSSACGHWPMAREEFD
jgi:SAM-dependent methyltransferase